jgi:hypothetical protein
MNYIVKSNNILFENGYSLDFEYPIKDTLLISNIIIILIDPPFDTVYNQNIFAISLSGDFLWRIGNVKLYNDSNNCPYVGIIVNKSNELVLFNWCDTAVIVNSQTGDIINTYQTK